MVQVGNVDNTSELAKPISIATQTALNLKYSQADANILGNYTYALGNSLDENYYAKVEVDQFVSQLNSNLQKWNFRQAKVPIHMEHYQYLLRQNPVLLEGFRVFIS